MNGRFKNSKRPTNNRGRATVVFIADQKNVVCPRTVNLESINVVLIHQGLSSPERLAQLNAIAITQMRSLVGISAVKRLGESNTSKKIEP